MNKEYDIDETKPRTWLLLGLIIIAIIICVLFAMKIMEVRRDHLQAKAEKQAEKESRLEESRQQLEEEFNKAGVMIDSIINGELVTDMDKHDKDRYNNKFEFHKGEHYGASVRMLLDEVIENNKKNESHPITVVYGENKTTDTEIIKSLKSNFIDWNQYEVSIDYDTIGLVSIITIEGV